MSWKGWKRRGYMALLAIASAEILWPLVFHEEPAHFWFENLPAFGSLYGFLSCILIIKVSKLLGTLLVRPEDYYDR